MNIKHIILHHAGGTQDNPLASSAHLTVADIDREHQKRFMMYSSLGHAAGYHFVYEPKTRGWTQTRRIGDNGAHTIGFNNEIGVCIIGNYQRIPLTSRSVDPLTSNTIEDIARFCLDLVDGNKREWAAQKDTLLRLSPFRIRPHRFYTHRTDCFGSFIPDDFFTKEVLKLKYGNLASLVAFLGWLNPFYHEPPLGKSASGRECQGYI